MSSRGEVIYIKRDADGGISEVSLQPQSGFEAVQPVATVGPSAKVDDPGAQANPLESTDLALVRVLEDLIDLLIARDVIRFTDLPDMAQRKLLERRSLRAEMRTLDLLGEELDVVL